MKFKKLLLLLFFVLLIIDGINAKIRLSFGGRSSRIGSKKTSHTSGTTLYKSSKDVSVSSHKPTSFGQTSPPVSGKTWSDTQNFLKHEGGGAKRPATPTSATGHGNLPSIKDKPNIVTESKQTSSFQPSAPQEHDMKSSTGKLQNKGHSTSQTYPSWSNPYLSVNRSTVPGPHLGTQPPSIGFEHYTHTQNRPPFTSSQSIPSTGGHPPYHYPTSTSSFTPPNHIPNPTPVGNPYSTHPFGSVTNTAGQTYYPQQSHILPQPAPQPYVPGQTILMIPGQQDSGRGLGQMIKEALVFSTINAGVNRLINPSSKVYVEHRPDTASSPTTHVTYNNQYFNVPPGVNGTMNSANVPQGTGNDPSGTFTPNVGASNPPSSGSNNMYIPNISNNGATNSNGAINGGVFSSSGTVSGTGETTTGTQGNIITSTTGQSTLNNLSGNVNSIENTIFYRISDDELFKLTEELFIRNSLNISKYIKLNLQNRVTSPNITDEAKEPLFYVEPELLEYPSIYMTRSLYDTYENDYLKKVNRTLETRKQENLLLDTFLNTNVMATAMQWLADRGFIDPDDFERKDILRRIWFTLYNGSSCGFERVFASENYGTAFIGAQDWIYFEYQESSKRIDYMGYIDKVNLGNVASLVKLNSQMDGVTRQNATIFVGTLPEFEMALYTVCFHVRPKDFCPVSLGGTRFNIYTHSLTYFGKEVIDLAFPMI